MTASSADLRWELQKAAENFRDTRFNYVNLSVLERTLGDDWADFIHPVRPADYAQDWLSNGAPPEVIADFRNGLLKPREIADKYSEEIEEFIERNRYADDNYPIASLLFEWRDEPGDEWLELCKDAGFGVIEPTRDASDYFNPLLFLRGAGYSALGEHWIPLYLSLFPAEAEEYKGVDYGNL